MNVGIFSQFQVRDQLDTILPLHSNGFASSNTELQRRHNENSSPGRATWPCHYGQLSGGRQKSLALLPPELCRLSWIEPVRVWQQASALCRGARLGFKVCIHGQSAPGNVYVVSYV